MSIEKATLALVKAVKGITQDPQATGLYRYPVRWPNADLQQPVNAPFITVDVLFSGSEPVTLGIGGEDEFSGIIQISLYTPLNIGDSVALKFCDTLKGVFFSGAKFSEMGTELLISRYAIAGPSTRGQHRTTHFSAYWLTRFNRPTNN